MNHNLNIWLIAVFVNIVVIFHNVAGANNITLNLQCVPVQNALQLLADHQKINLIICTHVEGNVTLNLVDVSWQQALDSILQAYQLKKIIQNNLLLITSQNTEQKQAVGSSKVFQEKTTPLESAYFNIRHADPQAIAALLKPGSSEGLLSTRGSIYVDKRTHLLLVKDEKKNISAIKTFISKLDQEVQQIQIEARIVTVSHEDMHQLGVQWHLGQEIVTNVSNESFTPFHINLPISSANSKGKFQIAKINGKLLDLELSALEHENRVKIIAAPRLLTSDRHTASIKQGTEIPYVIAHSKNNSSIEFREAVLGLEVTPHILLNKHIIIDLQISQNTPGQPIKIAQGEAISIDKQEIRTQVMLNDGETVVLGGVFQSLDHQGLDRVPLLSQLPVLGNLFRRKSQQITKKELLIFITAKIMPEKFLSQNKHNH